jgi:hypothetical protein
MNNIDYTYRLFALTRSNLLRQLPNENGIVMMFPKITTASNSMDTYF